jgi:glutaredoxin
MASQITVYGADWCGDTVRTKRHLDRRGVEYEYVDVDENPDGERKVIEFNKGKRRIPMVEIASDDGGARRLSVPSESELEGALK